MNKFNSLIITAYLAIISSTSYATSPAQLQNDYQAYQSNDKTKITDLALTNTTDIVANYLAALSNLKTNLNPAIIFFQQDPKNPLAISLSHKILDKSYESQDWNTYTKIYNQTEASQLSQNETCGQKLANYILSQKSIDHDFITQMIKNKMPDRCLSLIATLSANGQIPNNELIPTLYNLLIHNQTSQFNQIANQNKIENYQLNDTSNPNKYQLVYQISQLAIKTPDEALAKLEQSKTDKFTKQYLYNYVATRLAIKQMFSLALIATNKGHSSYLTDDQFEWKARIFLANNQWSDTLASIKKMPKILQDTNKWLYWKAYAEKKLGRNKQGNTTLGKVSSSPSFYSLLARSELGINPTIPAKIAHNDISSIKYYDYAKLGFDLYSTGTTYNNSYYKNLGTYVLYRTIAYSNDTDKAAISNQAYKLGITDTAIYAAIKMDNTDINLAFPMPYLDSYIKYSNENGIPVSIPLAISRQESRFNATVVAFDGGVGLMQLMPATANFIAKKLGVSNNCYKDYPCNIQEGTWFIADLYHKFGNNLIYASSGYNAGPGRARRWEKAFYGMDNQLQTELIPFDITRTYTQHILTNQLIYDAILNKKSLNMVDYLKQINNKDQTFIDDNNNNSGNDSIDKDTSDNDNDNSTN